MLVIFSVCGWLVSTDSEDTDKHVSMWWFCRLHSRFRVVFRHDWFHESYSVIYGIYIPGKPGICVQFMMSANSRIRFGLQIVFVCLYIAPSRYHHCANFIWRHWTYKMLVRYNLSSMWVRLSIISQLSIMWGCVFSVYPFTSWWLREYTYFVLLSSSTRKYELLLIV